MAWLYMLLLVPGSLHSYPQGDGGYIDGSCWWCNDDQSFPPASPTEESFEEDATMCECVPWYLCGNNAIITDGAGLLDLRTIPVKNVKECPNPMHTCCGIPPGPVDDGAEEPKPEKLPPNTPCDCTSYRDCPERLIVNDGKGKTCLNVARSASSHSSCPHVTDVCCANNVTEVDIAIAAALTSAVNDNSILENCQNVEAHMCDEYGYIKANYSFNNDLQSVPGPGMVCCRPRPECECVDQDQCDDEGYIITDGVSLIDVRLTGSQSQTPGKCDDPCQVCCKLPEPIPSPKACSCVEKPQCSSYDPDYNYGDYELDIRGLGIESLETVCQNPEHVCCDTPVETPTVTSTTTTATTAAIATTPNTPNHPDTLNINQTTPSPSAATPSPFPDCGKRNRRGTLNLRIMGFQEGQSQFGEFPWVATVLREELIMNKPHHLFVGGGTLIHPRVVLTAAHKIHTLSSNKLHIRLGEWDTQTVKEPLEHQDLEVENIVIHPNFDKRNLRYDVGLIFLKEDAAFHSHIQRICLAKDLSEVDPNDCVINGWGKDGFANDGQYQKIMKSVELPLVSSDKCQAQLRRTRLGRYFRLHESFVCAGGEAGQDSCKGDGGGPLACARRGGDKDNYLLVGITAWGIGCGDEGVPGVYVDVPYHFDWINEQIEAVHPSTTTAPITEATATKQDCPLDCSAELDPVCANNGRTYGNPCELIMANCHNPAILLKHQGECKKSSQWTKLQKKIEREEKKKKRKQQRQQRRLENV